MHRKFSSLYRLGPIAAFIMGALCLAYIALGTAVPAQAQSGGGMAIVRDAEIESMLHEWTKPVIKAAGLDPDAIHFILVQNSDVNAFVAGGQNIFIFTGLLMKSKNPDEVIGVISHELGHIRGGHLVRSREAMEHASYESLLGTILGIGAAVLTGNSGAGMAIMSGSNSIAQRNYLSHSRIQESSADQAALTFLDRAKMSPDGLVSFMKQLESQELLPENQQIEYVRTHPLTRNRVEALEAGLDRSPYKNAHVPPEWVQEHKRMIAKLTGFITPQNVAWDYSDKDNSTPAVYARSIAAYRTNDTEKAVKLIDELLKREPQNPYFWELKGQMLVDFGRVDAAIPAYKKAVQYDPDSGLIRIAYAHALIAADTAKNKTDMLPLAIDNLNRALITEPRSPRIHRLLATAYGRMGDNAQAELHLAEEALLQQDYHYAKEQVNAALNGLKKGTSAYLRAQDILSYIEQADKKS